MRGELVGSMPKPSPGPPTIGSLIAAYRVLGHCLACQHAAALDLVALAATHGAHTPAIDLAPRLRCLRCGQRKGCITVGPRPGDDESGPFQRPDPMRAR